MLKKIGILCLQKISVQPVQPFGYIYIYGGKNYEFV